MDVMIPENHNGNALNSVLFILVGLFHGLAQMDFNTFYDYTFKILSLTSLILIVMINGKKWLTDKKYKDEE